MPDVTVYRSGDAVSGPIGLFYPHVIDMPIQSYLLHQDAKSHLEVHLDKQTADIVGSQEQTAQLLAHGLAESRELLLGIEDAMGTSNQHLSDISNSIDNISDQLTLIEYGIDQLALTVRQMGADIVRSLNCINGQLVELNHTAALIARLIAESELTWAREQAETAARAMRIGDLPQAEVAVRRALEGAGGHVGAPTHVEFMLQAAEILIREGGAKLADAEAMLERASRYLRLEPTETLQGRYHFALGTFHLMSVAKAESKKRKALYGNAKDSFDTSARFTGYGTAGRIYSGVASSALFAISKDKDLFTETGQVLSQAMLLKPQCAIEIWRLRGNKLDADAVDEAIILATAAMYARAQPKGKFEAMLREVEMAQQTVKSNSRVTSEFVGKMMALEKLGGELRDFVLLYDKRVATNDLTSAFFLGRDILRMVASILAHQANLKA